MEKDLKNKESRKKIQVLEEDRELMADFQKKIEKALAYNPSKNPRDPLYGKEKNKKKK